MEKNLFIDASHPHETRVVLKSGENIEDYEYENKKNILVKNINKSLFSWNLSSDSQSSNLTSEANAIGYVVNKHKNYILEKTSSKNLSILYRKVAHMFIKSNNYALAKKNYLISLRTCCCLIKNIVFFIVSHFFGCHYIKSRLINKTKWIKREI